MSEVEESNEILDFPKEYEKLKLKYDDISNENERIKKRLQRYETMEDKEEVSQIFDNEQVKMEFTGFRDNLQQVIVNSIVELENEFQDLIKDANMINKDCIEVRNIEKINPSTLVNESIQNFTNTNSQVNEPFIRDRIPEVVRENFPRDNIPSHSRRFRDHDVVSSVNNLKTQNEKNKNNIEGSILNSTNKYSVGKQNYGAPLSTYNLKINNPNFYPLNR